MTNLWIEDTITRCNLDTFKELPRLSSSSPGIHIIILAKSDRRALDAYLDIYLLLPILNSLVSVI